MEELTTVRVDKLESTIKEINNKGEAFKKNVLYTLLFRIEHFLFRREIDILLREISEDNVSRTEVERFIHSHGLDKENGLLMHTKGEGDPYVITDFVARVAARLYFDIFNTTSLEEWTFTKIRLLNKKQTLDYDINRYDITHLLEAKGLIGITSYKVASIIALAISIVSLFQ